MTTAAMEAVSVECNRELLIEALAAVTAFTPTRSPKHIWKYVCFDIGEHIATILATDMEIRCRVSIPGVVITTPGKFLLPPARLTALLFAMEDLTVRIRSSQSGVVVTGSRGEHRFTYQDPEEFPAVPEFEASAYHELPAHLFATLIHRTTFATDAENSRYALGGVLLELSASKVIGVATDGRRLAIMEGAAASIGEPPARQGSTIIQSRAMSLMGKLFGKDDCELQIAISEYDATVRGPRATVTSRLVEGRFPNWRDCVPVAGGQVTVEFSAGEILSCFAEVATLCDQECRGVDFVFSGDGLNLRFKHYDRGSSSVSTAIKYSGKPTSLFLDYRYILDVLRAIEPSKHVQMKFRDGDEEKPVALSTDDGYTYVVMPMARDEEWKPQRS